MREYIFLYTLSIYCPHLQAPPPKKLSELIKIKMSGKFPKVRHDYVYQIFISSAHYCLFLFIIVGFRGFF